jgi:hypothetical protein
MADSNASPRINGRLSVTHCDFCGQRWEPLDENGWCAQCRRLNLYLEIHQAGGALDAIEGAVRAAAEGNVHPTDIQERVESVIGDLCRAEVLPPTLEELHARLGEVIDGLAVDSGRIDDLEDALEQEEEEED